MWEPVQAQTGTSQDPQVCRWSLSDRLLSPQETDIAPDCNHVSPRGTSERPAVSLTLLRLLWAVIQAPSARRARSRQLSVWPVTPARRLQLLAVWLLEDTPEPEASAWGSSSGSVLDRKASACT